ncbi:hypothetical protein ACOW9W_004155 [Vibrio parahaemolyticus]
MDIFAQLKEEVNIIHFRWITYRQIYAQGPEVIELLNTNGGYFFYITQHLYLDNVALAFSKLTDPNRQCGKDNLSLKQLIVIANDRKDVELTQDLKSKFEALFNSCQKFRLHRNKRIAHADLEHAIGIADEPLPGISQQYVEDALALLREFMNTYELSTSNSQTAYQHLILKQDYVGDVLIKALQAARNA